jgi:hypothetical protein
VRRLVGRYRDRVKIWEIWNEPEQPSYWLGAPDPAGYARLLRAAYRGAKAGDPNAIVLFAATGFVQYGYVARTLESLAGARAFDAVAVHPYRFPSGPYEPVEVVLADGTTTKATLKGELAHLDIDPSWQLPEDERFFGFFGLFHDDGSPKPAAAAFREAALAGRAGGR